MSVDRFSGLLPRSASVDGLANRATFSSFGGRDRASSRRDGKSRDAGRAAIPSASSAFVKFGSVASPRRLGIRSDSGTHGASSHAALSQPLSPPSVIQSPKSAPAAMTPRPAAKPKQPEETGLKAPAAAETKRGECSKLACNDTRFCSAHAPTCTRCDLHPNHARTIAVCGPCSRTCSNCQLENPTPWDRGICHYCDDLVCPGECADPSCQYIHLR